MIGRRNFLGALLGAALAPSPIARAAGFAGRAPVIHCGAGLLEVGMFITISGVLNGDGTPQLFRITETSGGTSSLAPVGFVRPEGDE